MDIITKIIYTNKIFQYKKLYTKDSFMMEVLKSGSRFSRSNYLNLYTKII